MHMRSYGNRRTTFILMLEEGISGAEKENRYVIKTCRGGVHEADHS